ncbi:MAG TPA: polysaccharide biosynthesis tyrosine autokinase [Bryobacteraceae bacterium]|nr:polysaccharide biosynthesis tyrosine autokinase [Bryobacteraceae bacterium]
MELLPNGSAHDRGDLVPYNDRPFFVERPQQYATASLQGEETQSAIEVGRLVRKYWLLLVIVMVLGAVAGFASVVLSSPSYKSHLLLEVQSSVGSYSKGTFSDSVNVEASEIGIQTQVSILRSRSFLMRGAERLQQDSVPLAPTGQDIFSRLRQRVHPVTQDPLQNFKNGLSVAMSTFEARPVNHTRLIELLCESSSPDVAAQFLNSMAAEFVEDANRSRMNTAQKTSEWLAMSIEDTKSKMQEAEEKVREFSSASGNIFAGQDATLEDTKLASLKGDLARVQAELIQKQTRYELTTKYPPEALAEVLDDGVLRGYQAKINQLRQEKAALETKYTSKHQKVRELDAQLAVVEKDYQNEIHSVISRIKNDYEAAGRQEKLLSSSYNGQAQRVGSQAAKTSQYQSLRREADTLHQMYQSLLMQQTEAGLNSSVPVNPIRIIEQANPNPFPYKPQPVLNISFGCLLAAVLTAGIAFLRERMDHSIKAPGVARRLFNLPELGVIPNLAANGNGAGVWRSLVGSKNVALNGEEYDPAAALVTWQSGPSFITESFRGTLASILRNQTSGKAQKTILITSPGPSEGKTTVVQNLGIALAETGRRVLMVDADFRRPHLHRKFGLPNEWGLLDLLSEETPLAESSLDRLGVDTGFAGLSLLANGAGNGQASVSRALYSPRLREIFEILAQRYDTVLVDAPPILHVADARIISPLMDALILVLRCGVTDRASAMEAYQRIQEDGLSLLGTVLTDYDLASDRKRQYYYDYGDTNRV